MMKKKYKKKNESAEKKILPIKPEYAYAPADAAAKLELQQKKDSLDRTYGKWDEQIAFKKMDELQEEIRQKFQEVVSDSGIRIHRDDILALMRYSEYFRILIEIMDRLGDDRIAEKTHNSIKRYRKLSSDRRSAARKTWYEKYENMKDEQTTLFDELKNIKTTDLFLHFSIWDQKITKNVFVDFLLKEILNQDTATSKKLVNNLRDLDKNRIELVHWDLMNRFPGKQGLVLFHGTESYRESDRFHDGSGYLTIPAFFTDIPDYTQHFVNSELGGAMVVARIPFEKILYVALLFTKDEKSLEEPEISVMPGPLSELNTQIFYISAPAYEKFKFEYMKKRASSYSLTTITDIHGKFQDDIDNLSFQKGQLEYQSPVILKSTNKKVRESL
ncbi:hypothetical protein ACFL2G_01050 [Candidatus Omnitrophota bacterium]